MNIWKLFIIITFDFVLCCVDVIDGTVWDISRVISFLGKQIELKDMAQKFFITSETMLTLFN